MSYRWLVGALGLASLSLAACGDHRWLWPEGKGSDHHGQQPGPDGAVPISDGGAPGPDGAVPVSDGGAPLCMEGVFGHDVACEDLVQAKDQAGAVCQSRGLEMTFFGPASCQAGEFIRGLHFTCCPKTETPPPPPRRDPKSCESRSQGGETSCKRPDIWRRYAAEDCAAGGYELANISFPISCGGDSSSLVVYACCTKDGSPFPTPSPPPPPPPSPFDGPVVSGPARYAQYKCCLSTQSCTVEQVGGESVCKNAASWEADAAAACTGKGGTVYGLGLYQACSL